jgi:hypothetical protein
MNRNQLIRTIIYTIISFIILFVLMRIIGLVPLTSEEKHQEEITIKTSSIK